VRKEGAFEGDEKQLNEGEEKYRLKSPGKLMGKERFRRCGVF